MRAVSNCVRASLTRPLAKRERPKLTQDSAVGTLDSCEVGEGEQWVSVAGEVLVCFDEVQMVEQNGVFRLRNHSLDITVQMESGGRT